ncbi:DUF2458 conserved fungal protein [Schizosaccharomyces pombe]|uniref:Uncharacterized protein C557.02c n=1 Tax=Schizosaccharomyces pombe (strain 972 / ATCC 24843) TaxID=284812 RepID=YOA2_SCHPO|nr:uncharacterized protein SPBC557.02c [Schizosaccharomyces pombe]Q9USS4.1 RecName: Full=Uncharacterized protein C557.02c [Schizosaccharomyces pombe 972h-]CAB60669.1 conserved fungal protein [Schizosaccharomyces pombe]|eukprot:NP_596025.1 uncharacterized protein SPBC557.02c [Schizosaccharomyces pombe]
MDKKIADLLQELQSSSNVTSNQLENVDKSSIPLSKARKPSDFELNNSIEDAEKIKTYPAALRYIFALNSRHPEKLQKLRKMKAMQERQERNWSLERQRLVQHFESKTKLQEILKPLSSDPKLKQPSNCLNDQTNNDSAQTLDDNRALQEFDEQVVQLTNRMYKEQLAILADLKIPLFLSVNNDEELSEDQKRLLQLLQDLLGA